VELKTVTRIKIFSKIEDFSEKIFQKTIYWWVKDHQLKL